MTSGDAFEPDESPDIADRISGKNRARYEEPREGRGDRSDRSAKRGGRRGRRGASSDSGDKRPASTEEIIGDDDPLQGLGL